ncbi:putative HTH-type transcriptional regulator [bioreactor metagenome]|uniref:Putative HTH-type transcriptional regulator n=1 Tax=bioreactor metagenome TaxID=1076179 RepID=A0A645IYR1_9ZZZZ|nr:MerR family transcriptional regulator [Candidatus Metalachnospira sp.]
MYTVKEISKEMGMSEHTIRYYTDRGLVPNVKRDKNGHRVFDEESVNWLTSVKCLRECGMSLDSIKEYEELSILGDSTVEARYEIIAKQRDAAVEQLEEAKRRLEYLNKKVGFYIDIIDKKKPDLMNPNNWPVKPGN